MTSRSLSASFHRAAACASHLLVASSAVFALACSGSDPTPGTGTGTPKSTTTPPGDDGGSSAKPSPGLDAGADVAVAPTPASFVSNTPGATVVDVSTPPRPDLVVTSLNFTQHASGNQFFIELFGEVENAGTALACFVTVDPTYKDASGAVISTPGLAYADANPYVTSSNNLTLPCLEPGETGGFYQNGFVPAQLAIASTKTIEVKLASSTYSGATPAPHTPTATATVGPIFSGYGVTGSLTGVAGPVYNISYRIYPHDAAGLVLGQLSVTDLDTLAPGGTFPFTTTSVDAVFSQYRGFFQFIDGAKPAGSMTERSAESPVVDAVTRSQLALRAQRDATDARAAQAR